MNLLLVGGGHAMLPALLRAPAYESAGVSVTLLDASPHLYYSGMVPEYLGGVYTRSEVRIDLKRLCRRKGVRFVQGRATELHPEARTVVTRDGRTLPYDLAAFDIGTRPPGLPASDAAIPTKPLHYIERLAQRVRRVLEKPAGRLRLAIAGGGAAGVEIALNLTARFRAAGRSASLRLALVEPAQRLLPAFPRGMSRWTAQTLRRRGVRLHLGQRAKTVSERGLSLTDGEAVPASAVLWATGTTAPPLFAEAGLQTDESGFAWVESSLRVRSHPRLFVAGDCARIAGHETLARVGVHAVKQGPVLAENLACATQVLTGKRPADEASLKRFRPYPVAPLLLSTGTPTALWTARSFWLKGRSLLRLKHFVDRRWMRPYHDGRWRDAGLRDWLRADAALGTNDSS